jgi:hypothetical protein
MLRVLARRRVDRFLYVAFAGDLERQVIFYVIAFVVAVHHHNQIDRIYSLCHFQWFNQFMKSFDCNPPRPSPEAHWLWHASRLVSRVYSLYSLLISLELSLSSLLVGCLSGEHTTYLNLGSILSGPAINFSCVLHMLCSSNFRDCKSKFHQHCQLIM